MITPVLKTDRMTLRPLVLSDAEAAFRGWTSDPEVAKYMRWNLHKTVGDTKEWLAAEEENIGSPTYYDWGFVFQETGELIGCGGLVRHDEHGMFELGYNIMRQYWNRGLATEAAGAITDFARRQLGVRAIVCGHAKENPASGKVMEKVGFIYQADSEYLSFDGKKRFGCKEYLLTFDEQ
ncbi:MAG TPA: GNAT family N-acetyltransferase [Clostridia bacterium]|nr:GNAT family N-acetyltransferase [Clostridia bacterium]